MDNENKVVLNLSKYDELNEKIRNSENKLMQICSLILNYTELDDKKERLTIDTYHMKYGRLMDLLKEICPVECEFRRQELIKDDE